MKLSAAELEAAFSGLLRTLGLVTARRTGRTTTYSLYDQHVAHLLDEAVYHAEHLRLAAPDISDADAS